MQINLTQAPAQSQSIMVTTFFEALSTDKTLSAPTRTILWDLYRLFALNIMENDGYECMTSKKTP
jgi:acyl-CoA oxidase